jgi:hypothetical protein
LWLPLGNAKQAHVPIIRVLSAQPASITALKTTIEVGSEEGIR